MRSLKLPLWALIVAVVVVGLGFAALKNPTELVASAVFTLTVGILFVAVLAAIATTGRKRLAWLAFGLSGSIYLFLAFNPVSSSGIEHPPLLTTLLGGGNADYRSIVKSKSSQAHIVAITGEVDDSSSSSGPKVFYYGYDETNYADEVNKILHYQVVHSLAALPIGFLAFLATLLVTAFRREPVEV